MSLLSRFSASDMSMHEKELWCELIVSGLVSFYFFSKTFGLMMMGDEALMGREMARLIIKTISLSVVLSIVVYGIVHASHRYDSGKPEPVDERDKLFAARATSIGYRVLIGMLCILLGQIVMEQMWVPDGYFPFTLTPLIVGHLMLVAMAAASLAKAISGIVFYRRGN